MVKLVAKTCINWALEITAITSCAWPLHGWGHGGCYSEAVGCWVMDLSFFRCIHTPLRVQSRVSNAGCAMQIMLSMLHSCCGLLEFHEKTAIFWKCSLVRCWQSWDKKIQFQQIICDDVLVVAQRQRGEIWWWQECNALAAQKMQLMHWTICALLSPLLQAH